MTEVEQKNYASSQESASKVVPFTYSLLCPFQFSEKACEGLHMKVDPWRKKSSYCIT